MGGIHIPDRRGYDGFVSGPSHRVSSGWATGLSADDGVPCGGSADPLGVVGGGGGRPAELATFLGAFSMLR